MLNDTATVTGGFQPAGSITFNLYDPAHADCSGTPAYTQTVTVAGAGSYPTTNTTAAAAAGTWRWTAVYTGDTNNKSVTTECTDPTEHSTVNPATPSISTSPSASAVAVGATVTDTATLSGGYAPTGSISWNVYAVSDTACLSPLNSPLTTSLTGSSAVSPPFTPGAPGTYQFVGSYPGDANNQAATGSCGDSAEQFAVTSSFAGSRLQSARRDPWP